MKGFELVFMAPRSRRHNGKPVIDVMTGIARAQGIKRYTRRINTEGIDPSGHTYSSHFFELADEPEELTFVLDGDQAERLLRTVKAEDIHVFCMRRPIDYWQFGAANGAD